jgi:hypothetical protein
MAELNVHVPMLAVTNPILLWLFKHGWEDPSWGRMPINQVALGLMLHELSGKLANAGLREQLAQIAGQVVAENAREVLGERPVLQ